MEEWEEPLHPGSLVRTYPTFSHNATPRAHFLPPDPPQRPRSGKTPAAGLFRDGADGRPQRARLQVGLQIADRGTSPADGPAPAAADPLGDGSHMALHTRTSRYDRLPCPSTAITGRQATGLGAAAAACWRSAGAMAGCGSSHATGTAADPATAVPASAPLYAGAIVRPEGSLKKAASGAGQGAHRTRPTPTCACCRRCRRPGAPPLDFKRDVAPWLGPSAGVFLSSLGASEDQRSAACCRCSRGTARRARRRRAHSRSPPTASRARSCSTPPTPARPAPS